VLLDNFVSATNMLDQKEMEERALQQKVLRQFKNPLEPLIARYPNLECPRAPFDTRSQQAPSRGFKEPLEPLIAR
jgi:hypothetical protein